LQEGLLSEDDAVNLTAEKLALAVGVLQEALPDAVAIRLLERLGREHPEAVPVVVVRPGYWVRCSAGWGRIERIETADGGARDSFFASDPEPGLCLRVRLRAHQPTHAEEVVLSLGERTVAFLKADTVYTCAKCEHFSSSNPALITGEHTRSAHGGIGPAFRAERTTVLQQARDLEFSFFQPANPWC
jgi:hypothetical protein